MCEAAVMEKRRIFNKVEWQKKLNGKKPRRLQLKLIDGVYICPVNTSEKEGFYSQRGCRKHDFMSHGWYYFFDEKPETSIYFPETVARLNMTVNGKERNTTAKMP